MQLPSRFATLSVSDSAIVYQGAVKGNLELCRGGEKSFSPLKLSELIEALVLILLREFLRPRVATAEILEARDDTIVMLKDPLRRSQSLESRSIFQLSLSLFAHQSPVAV